MSKLNWSYNMTSLQTLADRLCEIVNGRKDPELTRYFQQELSQAYPLVYWSINDRSGKLSGTLR